MNKSTIAFILVIAGWCFASVKTDFSLDLLVGYFFGAVVQFCLDWRHEEKDAQQARKT